MPPNILVTPYLPFPNLSWWAAALSADAIKFDPFEHFEKMSFRNRYMISSATGVLSLSIPLFQGRQQRKIMADVLIDQNAKWQLNHWRTIKSVYNRAPYFEYFEDDLKSLFEQPFVHLVDFNEASILFVAKTLGISMQLQNTECFKKQYPDLILDIRKDFKCNQYNLQSEIYPNYHQVFEDRLGFLPNLSILDLLFAEGKHAHAYLP